MKKMLISMVFSLFLISYIQAGIVRYSLSEFYRLAEEYIGSPYKWGGEKKEGIDCSGLTSILYSQAFGIELPRVVRNQVKSGRQVKGSLIPGDLVFFNTTGVVSHVGVYLGGNQFIHASSWSGKSGVIRSSLSESYFKKRYTGARRYFDWKQDRKYETGDSWKFAFSRTSGKEEIYTLQYYMNGHPVMNKLKRAEKNKGIKDSVLLSSEGLWTAVLFNRNHEIMALESLSVDNS